MSGTWLFDLGNSRLKTAALRDDGGHGPISGWSHAGTELPDAVWDALPAVVERAVVSSVAGSALTAALVDGLEARGARVERVSTQSRAAGVTLAYADPSRLGVDRWLALLAAHALGGDALLVGVGTALTVDLLRADGRHLGGRIAPSPDLMRAALHARVPHLPAHGGAFVPFAADTADALASGCDGAAIGLVERSLVDAAVLLGHAPMLVVHGGGSGPLLRALPAAVERQSLVVEGLALHARGEADAGAG